MVGFDPARPLWDLCVVPGYEGRHTALVFRAHPLLLPAGRTLGDVVSDVLEERSVVRGCLVAVAVVLQALTQLLAALQVVLALLGEAGVMLVPAVTAIARSALPAWLVRPVPLRPSLA